MRAGPALEAMGFEEYDRLSAAGGLVPVYREMPGDLMTPVSAFRAISRALAARVPARERGRRRARSRGTRSSAATRSSTLERAPGVVEDGPGGRRRVDRPLLAAHPRAGRPDARPTSRTCRASPAAPSATSPTTRSACSRGSPPAIAPARRAHRVLLLLPVAGGLRPRAPAAGADRRRGGRAARRVRRARRTPSTRCEEDLGRPAPQARGAARAAARPRRRLRPRRRRRLPATAWRARRSTSAPATSSRSCSRGSTRWPAAPTPFDVYRALRMVNPSPYMYFLKDGDSAIAGRLAGDAGPRRERPGRDAAARRHPAAGRRPRRRTSGSRRRCARTPRSAPSTSCWWTSAATTSAACAASGRSPCPS